MPWSKTSILTSVVLTTLGIFVSITSGNKQSWEAPGCHLVGHTRTVTIADCVPFEVTTNACRGFCVSYAVPSSSETLTPNRNFAITSKAQCCGIVDTHECGSGKEGRRLRRLPSVYNKCVTGTVKVWVACRDGFQQKTFKSALSCACSICRRNH